jgi:hypothetical protein
MSALISGHGEVGYFILSETLFCQCIYGMVIHPSVQFVIGRLQRTGLEPVSKDRSFLYFEAVTGYVPDRSCFCDFFDRFRPILNTLFGKAEDKVGVDIIKAGPHRSFQVVSKLPPVMYPAQHFQQTILPCLQSDAEAVDPGHPVRSEAFICECSRIAFNAYFSICIDPKIL